MSSCIARAPIAPSDRDSVLGRVLRGAADHSCRRTCSPTLSSSVADWQEIGGQRTVARPFRSCAKAPCSASIILARTEVRPFTEKQIDSSARFADQAVIAIENVGLFEEVQARTRELTESLEYQTATSDVLNVISRSPNDLQPVLDTIVETAHDLCEAQYSLFFKLGADGLYHIAAGKNADPGLLEWLRGQPDRRGRRHRDRACRRSKSRSSISKTRSPIRGSPTCGASGGRRRARSSPCR